MVFFIISPLLLDYPESRRRAKARREKTAGVCEVIVERCGKRRIRVVDNVESFDDSVEPNLVLGCPLLRLDPVRAAQNELS